MEESSTYQFVIEKGMEKGILKGRKKELLETLLHLGTQRFGTPAAAAARLEAIDDLERLDRMRDRLLDAPDWNDLLATP